MKGTLLKKKSVIVTTLMMIWTIQKMIKKCQQERKKIDYQYLKSNVINNIVITTNKQFDAMSL